MKSRSAQSILFAGISLLVLAHSLAASGQTSTVKKELDWSLRENEIETPQFSPDGNFIALVTRGHWPDGEEAESLPESFFTKLEQRKQKDPRFADPVISLIDLKGNQVCEVRYGTSPAISPDNSRILFSRQIKPITGLRPL